MTSIQQLQISGIRSFDPNPSNKQTIYFQKPLTVILGKNGAGKTTIIEALLNACAGTMPPGSGQEKSSFLYDSKIAGASEVKAQIRLIFTGKDGKMIQVIRSFQVTRLRQRVTFNTLDNTVAYQDPTSGKVISSTYKASQVDRVVPEMLGVSPAVLEHVVFCHQEASNWPLSSPKEVKQIFDEIFSATRYVLALERFREISKEYRQQLKEQEGNLLALQDHREQAQTLQKTIHRKEEIVHEMERRANEELPRLAELQAALTALDGVDQQVDQWNLEAAALRGRTQEKQEALQRVAAGLEQLVSSISRKSPEELQQELQRRMHDVETAVQDLDTINAQLRQVVGQMQTTEGELRQCSFSVQNLEREEFEHEQHCTHLRNLLGAAKAGELFSAPSVLNESKAEAAVRESFSAASRIEERMTAYLGDLESQAGAMETKRHNILRRMDADAKEREMLEGILEQLKRRLEDSNSEITRLRAHCSPKHLQGLREAVAAKEAKVTALRASAANLSSEQEVQRVTAELEKQRSMAARLQDDLSRLRSISGQQEELRMLRQRLQERRKAAEQQWREELEPGVAALHLAVQSTPVTLATLSSLTQSVESYGAERRAMLQTATAAKAESERRVVLAEGRIDQDTKELTACEAELAEVCHTITAKRRVSSGLDFVQRYETELQKAVRHFERLEHDHHKLQSLSTCFGDLLDSAARCGACPLCDRQFDAATPIEEFLSKNETRKPSDRAMRDATVAMKHAEGEVKAVEHLRGLVERARQLLFQQQRLQSRLESGQRSQEAADRAELEKQQDRCAALERECALAEKLARCGRQISQALQEEADLEEKVRTMQTALPAECPADLDSLMRRLDAAMEAQRSLHATLCALQGLTRGDDDIHAAERELQDTKSVLYRAEVDAQRCAALEDTARQLEVEAGERRSRRQELLQQRQHLQSELTELDTRVAALKKECDRAKEEVKRKCSTAQQEAVALQSAVKSALQFGRPEGFDRLTRERQRRAQLEATLHRLRGEETTLKAKLSERESTVSAGQQGADSLKRCLAYQAQASSLQADERRLEEIQGKLAALKGSKLQGVEDLLGPEAEKAPLSQLRDLIREKIRELERSRAQQEGSVGTMLDDVRQLKASLGEGKYQNIERRYRFTFVQVQTTRMAIKDIDKYYVALEKAVQSYHHEKITLINRIIADLWRQTYRGSDIDAVEIRSETENTSVATGRRSYNYRVVMKRGSNEIDMRGRCSAGQKVLASIIIRLALSEVFCYDCGILALDEPTTNLDEDNARSLADALRVLIESRRSVRHFQLVVITHDEQFVRALGGQGLDRFYFVHKDREGAFSVIDERTFDQLFV
eukprot:gene8370-5859_t